MADKTPEEILSVAAATETVPTRVSASPPGTTQDIKEPDAAPTPVTGKRPVDDVEEGEPDKTEQPEGDELLPPRKKARRGLGGGASVDKDSPESVDEGEVDSEGDSKEAASNPSDGQNLTSSPEQPPTPAAGTVAPNGLRTSFATSVPKNVHPDMAMHNPLTTEERSQLIAAIRDAESQTVLPLSKRDLQWTVPPIRADAIVGASWLDVFDSALDVWCAEFLVENQQNITEAGLAPSLLKVAFLLRLDKDVTSVPPLFKTTAKRQLKNPAVSRLRNFASDFKPDPKKAAKRLAKKQAKEAKKAQKAGQEEPAKPSSSIATDSNPKPGTANDSPQPSNDSPTDEMEDGEIDTDHEVDDGDSGSGELVSEEELDLRHRYYPGVPDDARFCTTCISPDHTTTNCPEVKCKFCQNLHFAYQCPSRQRCEKCKQLGHSRASCKEKLAVALGEGFMECAFCQGQDHQDENCTELWQTYHPKIGSTKKVNQLPIFCYCCGAQGHFGSDCGLADPRVLPSETWTTINASLYLDSGSSEEAIVYRNPLPLPPADSKPNIPGRSIKPQSHIIFEESDDDGEGFIRAPAAGAAGPSKRMGTIQIRSNINFGPAAPPAPPAQQQRAQAQAQQQQQSSQRKPRRGAQQATNSKPPPPQQRQGARRQQPRGGKQTSGSTTRGHQHPPLPPGPPPQSGGNGRSGGRGRGGFSNLGRRGRGRGGRGG